MQTIRRRSCFINGGFEPVAYSSKITAPVSPLIMISSPVDLLSALLLELLPQPVIDIHEQ